MITYTNHLQLETKLYKYCEILQRRNNGQPLNWYKQCVQSNKTGKKRQNQMSTTCISELQRNWNHCMGDKSGQNRMIYISVKVYIICLDSLKEPRQSACTKPGDERLSISVLWYLLHLSEFLRFLDRILVVILSVTFRLNCNYVPLLRSYILHLDK